MIAPTQSTVQHFADCRMFDGHALACDCGYDYRVEIAQLRRQLDAAQTQLLLPGRPANVSDPRDRRQLRVADWCRAAFGVAHATSLPQRGLRFLEEAVELAQAVGTPRDKAHQLIDYIYERPPGEIGQEFGGVGITLLAMAAAVGISADQAEADELCRILQKPLEHYAARNRAKNAAGFNTVEP